MRFVRVTISVYMLLLILCTGAVLYMRSGQPGFTLQATGIDLCGGTACFQGATVGVTNYADAAQRLSSYGKASNEARRATVQIAGGAGQITITGEPDSRAVLSIEFFGEKLERFPAIGDWVQRFGTPCGVFHTRSPGGGEMGILAYATSYIVFPQRGGALTPDARLTKIVLMNPLTLYGAASFCALPRVGDSRIIPWRGFASWRAYQSRGLFLPPDGGTRAHDSCGLGAVQC